MPCAIGAFLGGAAGGAMAAIASPLPAWAWLEWRGNRNMAQLADSMLGLLERIRQLLSVGNSLQTALARAVENAPPVAARALAGALRRINNGAGVADSVERAASELGIYELHMLGTAARTNLRFGGPLNETLKHMIENIRRRAAVERELRAHNRDYGRWFLDTAPGHHMILYAVVSQMLGILVMRAITRTRY
jgi:tight adherence protein B